MATKLLTILRLLLAISLTGISRLWRIIDETIRYWNSTNFSHEIQQLLTEQLFDLAEITLEEHQSLMINILSEKGPGAFVDLLDLLLARRSISLEQYNGLITVVALFFPGGETPFVSKTNGGTSDGSEEPSGRWEMN